MIKIIFHIVVSTLILSCSELSTLAVNENERGVKLNIDIQWGGYYASKEKGDEKYGVFRLLDFNRDAYHAALFKEKFTEVPALDEVAKLSPYIGHAPIDSKALLREREIVFIGGPPLAEGDLDGYTLYLGHHGMIDSEKLSLVGKLIEFSKEPPMKLTLKEINGELRIEER